MQLPIRALFERFFFGSRCIGCGNRGVALCGSCIRSIVPAPPTDIPSVFACYSYSDPLVQKSIWELKYHHHAGPVRLLAHAAQEMLTESISDLYQGTHEEMIVLVPVPQHKKKHHVRGFNQAQLIATWLAEEQPYQVEDILEKRRETMPQAHISHRIERFHNVSDSIAVRTGKTISPTTRYIIVDDVTTTGATLLECMRALRASGAAHVIGFALAHGYKKR